MVEVPAIGSHAMRICLGYEIQFLIGVDGRLNVFALVQQCKCLCQRINLRTTRNDGLHTSARLRGISRIGNHDPVAVTIEWKAIFENLFPVRTHREVISSSKQTATFPHLPDAINAYASAAFSRGKR